MWPPDRTAIRRMRKDNPTNPTRPLSIDQRAEDGGASSLSNDIDRRITRSDAIARVCKIDQQNTTEAEDTFRPSPVTSILFHCSSRGQAR
ncbi:uncharacterized [Tachysurus ichikawai]